MRIESRRKCDKMATKYLSRIFSHTTRSVGEESSLQKKSDKTSRKATKRRNDKEFVNFFTCAKKKQTESEAMLTENKNNKIQLRCASSRD
jgi:hypothetical protein